MVALLAHHPCAVNPDHRHYNLFTCVITVIEYKECVCCDVCCVLWLSFCIGRAGEGSFYFLHRLDALVVTFLLSEEHLHICFELLTICGNNINVHRRAVNEGCDVAVQQLLVIYLCCLCCKVGMIQILFA